MQRYNLMRPIFLILIAVLTKMFVQNASQLLGASPELAENLGFLGMIIAAYIVFLRMRKKK